jgi:hypothetical protein
MSRASVTRINGAPGVGKSTLLTIIAKLEASEEETIGDALPADEAKMVRDSFSDEETESLRLILDRDGVPLDGMYYASFARSSVPETVESLMDVYQDASFDDISRRAKTMHGVANSACRQAGLFVDTSNVDGIPGQVIQQRDDNSPIPSFTEPFSEFARQKSLDYTRPSGGSKMGNSQTENYAANQLYRINEWLTYKRKDNDQAIEARSDGIATSIPWDRVETLLDDWDRFKKKYYEVPVYEHHDYVDVAIDRCYTPDARVLFIDEFQDLNDQEYKLFKTWRDSGAVDRIYIAGDPAQSIYSFRSSSPYWFENTHYDFEFRRKSSFRCPPAVADVASSILGAKGDHEADFSSRKDGSGSVSFEEITDRSSMAGMVREQAIEHEPNERGVSTFVLCPTNRQVSSVSGALNELSIPHDKIKGSKKWTTEMIEYLDILVRARDDGDDSGGWIKKDEAIKLIRNSKGSDARLRRFNPGARRFGGLVPREDLFTAYEDCSTAADIARLLDIRTHRAETLAQCVEMIEEPNRWYSIEEPDDPGDDPEVSMTIRLGTIHSSKGLEAPSVVLLDAFTGSMIDRYQRDPENAAESHRVMYVGATRASETLTIVRGFVDNSSPVIESVAPIGGTGGSDDTDETDESAVTDAATGD